MERKITDAVDITVQIRDLVRGYERACIGAQEEAWKRFGIDDSGHSETYDFMKYKDSIRIKLVGHEWDIGWTGSNWPVIHVYRFKAWIVRNEEDSAEEDNNE